MSKPIVFLTVRELHDAHLRCADRVAEDDGNAPERGFSCNCVLAQATGQSILHGTAGGQWKSFAGDHYLAPHHLAPPHYALVEQAFEAGDISTHEEAAALLRARYPKEFVGYESPECVRERLTAERLMEVEAR